MNIAIQGIKGSFHHIAAKRYFGDEIKLTECLSFSEMPDLIKSGAISYAMMAVEETNIGAIQSNYGLIDKHNLNIEGETYLSLHHSLIARPGQSIEDIKEICSHPIVFNQCQKFLKTYPHIKLIEAKDTAFVAKEISEKKLKGIAAIGSDFAAKLYGLDIIADNIQNETDNIIRFFVLRKDRKHKEDDYLNNKASLKFSLPNEIGTLAEVFKIFRDNEISVSKINSVPVKNQPFRYAFFVDVSFGDYHKYCQGLLALNEIVTEIKILGEYKSDETVFSKLKTA